MPKFFNNSPSFPAAMTDPTNNLQDRCIYLVTGRNPSVLLHARTEQGSYAWAIGQDDACLPPFSELGSNIHFRGVFECSGLAANWKFAGLTAEQIAEKCHAYVPPNTIISFNSMTSTPAMLANGSHFTQRVQRIVISIHAVNRQAEAAEQWGGPILRTLSYNFA